MIRKIIEWLDSLFCYVIADSSDNSITISHHLFHKMNVMKLDAARVFVFRTTERSEYAFTVNPHINRPTQLCDIQYNSKHRCIGFESLCPTVNRIFYDYGIRAGIRAKLSVSIRKRKDGLVYYIINKPHGKSRR